MINYLLECLIITAPYNYFQNIFLTSKQQITWFVGLGCVSFVHIHSNNRGKLDPKALKCVFMGYSSTQKGYKSYHLPIKQFFVPVDVTLIETENYFPNPYLQEETSLMEDQNRDLFLFDLSSFPSPQNQNPLSSPSPSISIPLPNELDPSTLSPTAKDEHIQSATHPLEVYSRKKKPLVQQMQVHNSEPISRVDNIEIIPNSEDY